MINARPVASAANVSVAAGSGRPRTIHIGGSRLPVTALEVVREETAAYPLEVGPRTVFVVRAGPRRFRLVHSIRDRRWHVEELVSGSLGSFTRVA
jgi:hypothetical protein